MSALLRGQAAPATVQPEYPMRTVTLTATDDQGGAANRVGVTVVNVDDSIRYVAFPAVVDGIAKISVPDGHCTAMVTQSDRDAANHLVAERMAADRLRHGLVDLDRTSFSDDQAPA